MTAQWLKLCKYVTASQWLKLCKTKLAGWDWDIKRSLGERTREGGAGTYMHLCATRGTC